MLAASDLTVVMQVDRPDTTRAWYALQNLLTATANISKVLWGSGGCKADERAALRASLELSDSSPLRDVSLRNHFEHFDERLMAWWLESERHNFVDVGIGTASGISGIDDRDMFRNYEPTTGEIVFWGQRYNVRVIVEEVHALLPRVTEEAAKPRWDRDSQA